MANEDSTFLLVGAYASVEDARLVFPPALIGSAAVGAAVGALGDWRLEERIDELLRHAERRRAKELRDIDRAETEEQIGRLMSGEGS